jgi:hypothetical protein
MGPNVNPPIDQTVKDQHIESILKASHRHPHISDWEFIDGKLPVKK